MAGSSTTSRVGLACLVVVLLFVMSTNLSRSPVSTTRLSAQMSEQLNSVATRWGSGGEASVLKEEVTELRKRVKDLERHLTLIRTSPGQRSLASTGARAVGAGSAEPAAAPAIAAAAVAAPAVAAQVEGGGGAAVAAVTKVGGHRAIVTTAVATAGATREAPPVPEGVVGMASWFSSQEVQTANGAWCRMPPPFAALKPLLPDVAPPDDKPLLTSALAKKYASEDNLLIATYVNFNRLDFAFTLVKHLIALKNPHYLIGALDEPALRGMQAKGVPTFFMDSGLTTSDYGWGTANFRKLGLHKVQLVLDLAKTGVNCLTVDADAFLLRDPFPYIRNLPTADVLMSSDHLVASKGYADEGLEDESGFHSAFNIGYIYIKADAVEFVQMWRDQCYARPNDWDQVLFATALRRGGGGAMSPDRLKPLFKTKEGRHLNAGVLPVSLFASGHTFFVSRMAHLMRTQPYMVHTTFQYGGAQGKRHRLREAMIWEDDEAYYSQPDFLHFDLDVPYELTYVNGGRVGADGTQPFEKRMSVAQHFALLHHQLTQIRDALALAQALGRVLILPRLVCGLDRWWAPHSGIIPGSAARLPLLECPADHVIDLERMGKPEKTLREAGMLCNPRVPSSVLMSQRNVTLPHPAVAKDGAGRDAAYDKVSAAVRTLRQEHAAVKVLHVAGKLPDYRAVLAANTAKNFERTVSSYGGLWCCNRPPGGRGAGHIWYDFLWDVVPHRDRHNREWTDEWVPKMGP